MTDLRDDRRAEPPLEPWALELEGSAADSPTCRELSRVVALLRSLPEPEASPDLTERVLARVAGERARPRGVRRLWSAAPAGSPRFGLALAAGIAGLVAVSVAPERLPLTSWFGGPLAPAAAPPSLQMAAPTAAGGSAIRVSSRPSRIRRSSAAVLQPQFVSLYAPEPAPRVAFERSSYDEAFERHLDQQLNRLMLDPTAFAQRLEQMPQRDGFIARLSDRAAQRGDAPEIALSVRRSSHPLAGQIVNRMLRATLVARAPR